MLWLDIVSRVVHVSTAIVLVGGMVFSLFVLIPALKTLGGDTLEKFNAAVFGRWKRFVHGGILLFLLSGFYNYFQAMPLHKGDGPYHMLIGTKMLLAFGLFFLASVLVGRSKKFESMRQNRAKWLKLLVLMAAVIVSISGYLKIRGIPEAAEAAAGEETALVMPAE